MRISAVTAHNPNTAGREDGHWALPKTEHADLAQAGASKLDALPDNLKPEHLRPDKPDRPETKGPQRGKETAEIPQWLRDDKGAVYDGTRPCTCDKCSRRLYQDGSADAGVTFKAPTRIDPNMSHRVIASHEREHIKRETYQANQAGGKVVSAQVRLFQRSCGECGVIYCSGGMAVVKLRPNVSMYELMGYNVDEKV
jgi:hypothetical protein